MSQTEGTFAISGFTSGPVRAESFVVETIANGGRPTAYSFAPPRPVERHHCSRCARTFATSAGCETHERTYHGAQYGKRAP